MKSRSTAEKSREEAAAETIAPDTKPGEAPGDCSRTEAESAVPFAASALAPPGRRDHSARARIAPMAATPIAAPMLREN